MGNIINLDKLPEKKIGAELCDALGIDMEMLLSAGTTFHAGGKAVLELSFRMDNIDSALFQVVINKLIIEGKSV